VTSSDRKIFNDIEHRAASARAEFLVKLAVINCHFTSASDFFNLSTKTINNILVKHYYWLDLIYEVCF